jgi:hypothetical protein
MQAPRSGRPVRWRAARAVRMQPDHVGPVEDRRQPWHTGQWHTRPGARDAAARCDGTTRRSCSTRQWRAGPLQWRAVAGSGGQGGQGSGGQWREGPSCQERALSCGTRDSGHAPLVPLVSATAPPGVSATAPPGVSATAPPGVSATAPPGVSATVGRRASPDAAAPPLRRLLSQQQFDRGADWRASPRTGARSRPRAQGHAQGRDKAVTRPCARASLCTKLVDVPAANRDRVTRSRGHSDRVTRSRGHSDRVTRPRGHSDRVTRSCGDSDRVTRSRGDSDRVTRSRGHSDRVTRSRGHSDRVTRSRGDRARRGARRGDRPRLRGVRPRMRGARPRLRGARVARGRRGAGVEGGEGVED